MDRTTGLNGDHLGSGALHAGCTSPSNDFDLGTCPETKHKWQLWSNLIKDTSNLIHLKNIIISVKSVLPSIFLSFISPHPFLSLNSTCLPRFLIPLQAFK